MTNTTQIIKLLSLSTVFSLFFSPFAGAEMIIKLTNGKEYRLPVNRNDVQSITYDDSTEVNNNSWQGMWNTSEGVMTLTQNGSQVKGSYSQDSGVILGEVTGNTLNGYWIENNSAQKCTRSINNSFYWGRINFTLNSNRNSFQGLWGYCDSQLNGSWTGNR